MAQGLGFKGQGSGFRVESFGCVVWWVRMCRVIFWRDRQARRVRGHKGRDQVNLLRIGALCFGLSGVTCSQENAPP